MPHTKPTTDVVPADPGKGWRSTLLVLAYLVAAPVFGSQTTIYLRAQHIEVDQKSGLSTYRGKVFLRRGNLSFNANKAIVKQGNSNIESLTAFGNPIVIRTRGGNNGLLTTITGQRLNYLAESNRVVITGNVVTRQGDDVIRSTKVIYRVDDDSIVAESKNRSARVKAVFKVKRQTTPLTRAQKISAQ